MWPFEALLHFCSKTSNYLYVESVISVSLSYVLSLYVDLWFQSLFLSLSFFLLCFVGAVMLLHTPFLCEFLGSSKPWWPDSWINAEYVWIENNFWLPLTYCLNRVSFCTTPDPLDDMGKLKCLGFLGLWNNYYHCLIYSLKRAFILYIGWNQTNPSLLLMI